MIVPFPAKDEKYLSDFSEYEKLITITSKNAVRMKNEELF